MTNLAPRLEDLPGVASVEIDLDDIDAGGIKVRLEPGADQVEVTRRVHSLLVAYGVRSAKPKLRFRGAPAANDTEDLDVDVRITPIRGGARVEVIGEKVRSFRIVSPNAGAIAQGLSDAWCQVVGRIPLEVVGLAREGDRLSIQLSDGDTRYSGSAGTTNGLESALALAVGRALGLAPDEVPAFQGRPSSGS